MFDVACIPIVNLVCRLILCIEFFVSNWTGIDSGAFNDGGDILRNPAVVVWLFKFLCIAEATYEFFRIGYNGPN